MIRCNIIFAIIKSPEPIRYATFQSQTTYFLRVHLCASIQNILRSDFPKVCQYFKNFLMFVLILSRQPINTTILIVIHYKGWPTFISEIVPLIQKSQENSGMDELYALCSIVLRLCKIYEFVLSFGNFRLFFLTDISVKPIKHLLLKL